jgi:SPP1 gp7 family putative phage head morphogenesis protein
VAPEGVVPLIQATARRAVERISAQVGIAFDLLQPGLLPYVEKHAATLVTQVTDTTKQTIRDALGAGLADGDGIPALTKRIEESAAFSRDRAELIARTETTRVTNGSQRESLAAHAAATGDRITKRWLNAGDERVRDQHREPLNGEVRGVDEAFSNGLQAPGEPNCRCTLIYAMEG